MFPLGDFAFVPPPLPAPMNIVPVDAWCIYLMAGSYSFECGIFFKFFKFSILKAERKQIYYHFNFCVFLIREDFWSFFKHLPIKIIVIFGCFHISIGTRMRIPQKNDSAFNTEEDRKWKMGK